MWLHKIAWYFRVLLISIATTACLSAWGQTASTNSPSSEIIQAAVQPISPPVEDLSSTASGATVPSSLEDCFTSLARPIVELGPCERVLAPKDTATLVGSPGPTALEAAQARAVLGALYLKKQDLQRAQTNLEQAVQAAPDDAIVAGNYANLLLYQGNHPAAIESYNRILTREPDNYLQSAAIYLNRSLALRAIGRYDEAAKDYQLYLQLVGAQQY